VLVENPGKRSPECVVVVCQEDAGWRRHRSGNQALEHGGIDVAAGEHHRGW
jgi:hypothetical protein